MKELSIGQKKEWAKTLFLNTTYRYTQAEIADKVGISKTTISKWANQGKWEEQKSGVTITNQEQIRNLYAQLSEINRVITAREEGKRFATTSESDTIAKLANSIKKLQTETGISEIISVAIEFTNWVRTIDPASAEYLGKAKEITQLFDDFIAEKS